MIGKKILSLILCIMMVVTLAPAVAYAEIGTVIGTVGEYYTYSLDRATGIITFDMKEEKNDPIVEWHETELANGPNYINVKRIYITENVRPSTDFALEDYLYWFWEAEEIEVEEGNLNYSSQDGVLFNKDKTILYAYPAYKEGESYTIPDSVEQVGKNESGHGVPSCPFECAKKVKTIVIPASVTKIFDNSFANHDVGGGNSIEQFIVDEGNLNYKSVNGILFSNDGTELIAYPTGSTETEYAVPDGVKHINEDAFSGAMKLRKVMMPEGVETIGEDAFVDLLGTSKEITIPASVSSIGRGSLTGNGYRINIARGTKLSGFPSEAFYNDSGSVTVNIPCDLNWTLSTEEAKGIDLTKVHDMGKWVVTEYPNDEGIGVITRVCKYCDYKEVDEFVDEEGQHNWGAWKIVQEATISEDGIKERTCSICGEKEVKNFPAGIIKIDGTHFPDNIFRDYIAYKCDTDKDGALSEEERAKLRIINVNEEGFEGLHNIESLEGIEYFTELEELWCDFTKVKDVDLTSNTKLREVQFKHTPLTSIKLGKNENLYYLHVENTKITEIDTSGLPSLKYLNVGETNISNLYLGNNPELESLFCYETKISELELSLNKKLVLLGCGRTPLKELDLSEQSELVSLGAKNCSFISLLFSEQYDEAKYQEKFPEGIEDFGEIGEPGNLINYQVQNSNTVPKGKTEFDLTEWAHNIDADRISNLQGAILKGTKLTGLVAGTKVTYAYDCGAGFSLDVVIDVPATGGGPSGGGGGGAIPAPAASPVQKPIISAGNGYTTTSSEDGMALKIVAQDGYVIVDVLVNGVSKGAVTTLSDLKTGDKVEVKVAKKDESSEIEAVKAKLAALTTDNLTTRSVRTSKGNVKVTLKFDKEDKAIIDELKEAGYTVKYNFYRSTKKRAGYVSKLIKGTKTYINTYGKKGTIYYYKVRVQVYDAEGKLIAKTSLKDCKYASRFWKK